MKKSSNPFRGGRSSYHWALLPRSLVSQIQQEKGKKGGSRQHIWTCPFCFQAVSDFQRRDFADSNLFFNRCGPRKLSKAFVFCLGNAPDMAQPFSSFGLSSGSVTSQQSLLETLPEESPPSRIRANLRDEYFPPTMPSGADRILDTSTRGDNRKPLLLLVEDNEVNLRVC